MVIPHALNGPGGSQGRTKGVIEPIHALYAINVASVVPIIESNADQPAGATLDHAVANTVGMTKFAAPANVFTMVNNAMKALNHMATAANARAIDAARLAAKKSKNFEKILANNNDSICISAHLDAGHAPVTKHQKQKKNIIDLTSSKEIKKLRENLCEQQQKKKQNSPPRCRTRAGNNK